MFTILHISDLHRSLSDPIENSTLLGSLLSDQDRYSMETPVIPAPNAAIVSGDIIQGVGLGYEQYSTELDRQYNVAYEFLSELAVRMFEGDRSKIIIVPGNHDVCWNTARNAMRENSDTSPIKVNAKSFSSDELLRWDWASRQIFKITDGHLYQKRLDAYWRFIERFYSGVHLQYPIDSKRGFNLFSLDNGRILVAGLESVHGNDCYCRQGSLERSVLGACALSIRDLNQPPILKIATWHHSFQGPPAGDDYMDITKIHELIGHGFRLGFHGHQHLADANAHAIHLPEQEIIGISSAASLCAGQNELPTGANRGYNLVVIDDNYSGCRVHVREAIQGNQFGRYTRGIFQMDGFTTLCWKLPPSSSGSSPNPTRFSMESVIRAEDALRSGRAKDALEILDGSGILSNTHARRIYLAAAQELNKNHVIIDFIGEPTSVDEFVQLFGALLNERSFSTASQLLEKGPQIGVDKATLDDLLTRLNLKSRLGGHR